MLACGQRCGIVATHLPQTGAVGSNAVILTHDADIGRLEPCLEIRTDGCDENHEQILAGRLYSHLGRDTYLERTDIQRCTRTIRGDETLVEFDYLHHHLLKPLLGQRFHQDALGRLLQTAGVLLQTEDADFAILASESLKALEYLLTVMQTGRCDVKINLFALRDLNLLGYNRMRGYPSLTLYP